MDIIFVSLENWDEIWRRNQSLVAELTIRPSVGRILFVGLPINVTHRLKNGDMSVLKEAFTGQKSPTPVPGFPNVYAFNAVKWLPNTQTLGRKINEWSSRRQIARVCKTLGIERPLLWLNPHYAVHMVGRMDEGAVLYDVTDGWEFASMTDRMRRLVTAQDEKLCSVADLVVVCSEALEESRRPRSKQLLRIPNGVDIAHYKKVADAPVIPTSSRWPGPVFGYTGTLHPDRIDENLVIALARAFPDGSVILVGPDHLKAHARSRLTAEANVFLPGPVPYHDIADIMLEFHVCIVPHVETAFTESLNPIKLFEYLASGKPVASSNVAGFRDFPQFCHIGSGPEGFVAACRKALEEKDGKPERLAEARKHSWSARVDDLMCKLDAMGITQ